MSRARQVEVYLDAGNIKSLPEEDIKMILRGADTLIFKGGRNLLAKLLKGSKEKKVLEYKLNECPAYGYYHKLKLDEITKRIDWMIEEDYLRIEYDYRLPLLVFSEKGWEIEKETYAKELYEKFCLDVKEKDARIIYKLNQVNRKVVMRILDKIEEDGTEEFIDYLEEWKKQESKKVVKRINEVEKTIKCRIID